MLSLGAALIAAIEARVDDVPTRDGMTQVCRMVDTVEDWIDRMIIGGRNQHAWAAHEGVRDWLSTCRLDPFPAMMAQVPADGGPEAVDLQRLKDLGPSVQENLLKLRAQLPNSTTKPPHLIDEHGPMRWPFRALGRHVWLRQRGIQSPQGDAYPPTFRTVQRG